MAIIHGTSNFHFVVRSIYMLQIQLTLILFSSLSSLGSFLPSGDSLILWRKRAFFFFFWQFGSTNVKMEIAKVKY